MTTGDNTLVTITLTEQQRADAVALSGIEGGNGDAILLNIAANGLVDIGQNLNQNDFDNAST